MSFWKTLGLAALFTLFVPGALASAASVALDKEYVSEVNESGIGVAIKPPAGWEVAEIANVIQFSDGDSAITLNRYGGSNKAWDDFVKRHASYRIGAVYGDATVIDKGKAKFARQSGLFLIGNDDGKIFKDYYLPYGGYIFRFQMLAEEDDWDEVKPLLEKSLGTVRLLPQKKLSAPVVPKKLAAKQIMTGGKYGFDFSVQPPAGWKYDSSHADAAAFVSNVSYSGAVITFSREVDEDGDWNKSSKIFGILTDKQIKEFFGIVFSEMSDDMVVVSANGKEKINGQSQGLGAEVVVNEGGRMMSGKVVVFGHDGYIYSSVMLVEGDRAAWKKYQKIMEQSTRTFKLLD